MESKPQTLLEIALAVSTRKPPPAGLIERAKLALALIDGKIAGRQYAVARNCKGNAWTVAAADIAAAYRAGLVTITLNGHGK